MWLQMPGQWDQGPSFPHQHPHGFPPPDTFTYPTPGVPQVGLQGYGNPQQGYGLQGFPGPGVLPMPGWSGAPGGFPNPGLMMPPPDLVFQNAGKQSFQDTTTHCNSNKLNPCTHFATRR